MDRILIVIALLGLLSACDGQQQVCPATAPYRFTGTFICPPDMAVFMRSDDRPSIFPTNPCRSPPVSAPDGGPRTFCCPMVYQYRYWVSRCQQIGRFRVPCADICCRLCRRIPICRSWTYQFSTRICFLNRIRATPTYLRGWVGNNRP